MPTPKPTKHRMPTSLTRDGRGQRLWRDLTDRWEFTEAEYRDLENACHTADRIVKERRAIGDDYTVEGSWARSSPTRSSPSCAPTKTTSPTSSTGSTCPNPKNRPPPTHPEREAPGCAPSPTPAGARRSADGTAAQRQRRTDPRQDTRTRRDRRLVPPRARRRAGAPMGTRLTLIDLRGSAGRTAAGCCPSTRSDGISSRGAATGCATPRRAPHGNGRSSRRASGCGSTRSTTRPTVARQRGAPTAQGVGQGRWPPAARSPAASRRSPSTTGIRAPASRWGVRSRTRGCRCAPSARSRPRTP